MSKAELERFSKDVKASPKLQDELKKAGTNEQAVVSIANAKGYDFSVADLKAAAEAKKGELSEEQLQKVAGGGEVYAVGDIVLV